MQRALTYRIEPWRLAFFNTINFSLHPGQPSLLSAYLANQFIWACAGRRGGKSEIVSVIGASEFCKLKEDCKPGERWPKKILILAPEYKQARIIFGKVYRIIKRLGIPLKTDRFSAQEMEIESTWGALIMCMTGRNKDAWAGFDWDLIIVDEAPIFKDGRAFEEILFPTLLDGEGKFLSIGTPDFPGSFNHKWMLDGLDPDIDDWGYANWTTPDNWFLPKAAEFIERQRRTVPEDIIQRQYFAKYMSRSGLVYNEYLQCIEDFDTASITQGRWHRAGDFGYMNPFACLVVCQVGETTYIVDEYYEAERNNSEHAPHLKAMDREYPFHNRRSLNVFDPEDPGSIDYFSKWRSDSDKTSIKGSWIRDYAKGGIMDRIDMLRRRMVAGLVKIHPRCKQTIREFSVYAYPEKKADAAASEKPMDKNNHAVKALEYLTEYIFGDTFVPLDADLLMSRRSTRKSHQILKGYSL